MTLGTAWLFALVIASTAHPADSVAVTASARSMQPGELVVLTITAPASSDSVRLHAFNREIPAYRVDAVTWRALVGIDLGVTAGTYPVSIDARSRSRRHHTTYPLKVRPRRFPVRRLSVEPAFVNPPAEVRDRIAAEAAELERLWSQTTQQRLWNGPFLAPVQGATASGFGARSIFNGSPRSPHSGVDFVSPMGAPVAAPNAGRVVLARNLYFSGKTVVLDHGLGLFSLFAHFSVIDVHEGDVVSTRQEIGQVGATGRVTGPHLHWAVRVDGARVDPLALLTLLGR